MNRIAAILCFLLAGTAHADPKGAIVRIPSAGGSGTVIATGQGWSLILTAGHCFQGAAKNKAIALDIIAPAAGQKVGCVLIGADYQADVALLRLNYGPLPHVAPVAPAGFRPGVCESAGFDDMAFPGKWLPTHIKSASGGYYYTREAPWHGRSGGGLIDANSGFLVGVCSGYTGQHSRNEAARGEGVYAAHASIMAFLKRTRLVAVDESPYDPRTEPYIPNGGYAQPVPWTPQEQFAPQRQLFAPPCPT